MRLYKAPSLIDGSHSIKFIGMLEDEIIAFASLCMNECEEDHEALVMSVHISERYRAKGYGKKLIEYVITTAKANGKTCLILQVHEKNEAAIKLYSSFDFTPYTEADNDGLVCYCRNEAWLAQTPCTE